MNDITRDSHKEGEIFVSKRMLVVALIVAAVFMLTAAPAFAEGYNGYTWDGAGNFTDGLGDYTRSSGYFSGPHGGYNSNTNKCQDCHSTHYASGSYMLLRANSRESACDFCHVGGGGSTVNIQMDNDYNTQAAVTAGADSVIATDTMGFGTGHTLGYKGNAPVDINPAFSSSDGFACFDCHTPHGNSARLMEPFGIPGRPAGHGDVQSVVGVSFMAAQMYRIQEGMSVIFDFGDFNAFTGQAYPQDSYMAIPDDLSQLPHDLDGSSILKWSGADTLLDDVLSTDASITAEITAAGTNFGTWVGAGMTPKAPTQAQMFAWRTNPANFTGSQTGGKDQLSDAGVGALFNLFGVTQMVNPTLSDWDLVNLFMSWKVYWGEDVDKGNIVTGFLNMGDWQQDGIGGYAPQGPPTIEVWHKPLFPASRFLLIANPDSGDDIGITSGGINDFQAMGYQMFDMSDDGLVNGSLTLADYEAAGLPGSPDISVNMGTGAPMAPAGKKTAIDWEWPLGPAATWGPYFYTDTNERFPLAFPWAPKGVAMENEFCTSCHDGAAGMSNEVANVWVPDSSNTTTGTYVDAYSHDSNARGCARAQFLNPDDGDNFGPHCRNCHTGASSCDQCHDESGTNWNGGSAWASVELDRSDYTTSTNFMREGVSAYTAVPGVNEFAVAAAVPAAQCIDGGFSYPHRTLGANMLKDQLYGVDFDGTIVNPGDTRMDVASAETLFGAAYLDNSPRADEIAGQTVDNLDSVCIDCHGDGTYWNGGDDNKVSFTSYDPLSATGANWTVEGWELLLKGLP